MIIKSMPRKENSFEQLVSYIERDHPDGEWDIYYNFFANKRSEVIAEFQENATHLPPRKNGNVMYHEVISITRTKGLSDNDQKLALRDIVEEYIAKRAPNCLVFGDLHDEKDHNLHYHIIISANEVGDTSRHSLKKAQFRKIVQEHERWVNGTYPELAQGQVIEQQANERVSRAGGEMKRRTGRMPKREKVIAGLRDVFAAKDHNEAAALLAANNLELYTRGNTPGVIDKSGGKKYRLHRLGLDNHFATFTDRLELNALENGLAEIPPAGSHILDPAGVLSMDKQTSQEPEREPMLRETLLEPREEPIQPPMRSIEEIKEERTKELRDWHNKQRRDGAGREDN